MNETKAKKIRFILSLALILSLVAMAIQWSYYSGYVSEDEFYNQSNKSFIEGFELGLRYTASYTYETGNFTIPGENNTIQEIPLDYYCYQLNQAQLNQGDNK